MIGLVENPCCIFRTVSGGRNRLHTSGTSWFDCRSESALRVMTKSKLISCALCAVERYVSLNDCSALLTHESSAELIQDPSARSSMLMLEGNVSRERGMPRYLKIYCMRLGVNPRSWKRESSVMESIPRVCTRKRHV